MTTAREATMHLADLLRREHHALAEFLVALATFDRERMWVELGHRSLFSFLTRELGLSKGAAFYRNRAAELIQKYPQVVEPLRDGRLCLTTVAELSDVLTPENASDVLPRFFHLSRSEAKEVSAALQPHPAPALRTVVTPAPAPLALALSGATSPMSAGRTAGTEAGFSENLLRANLDGHDVAPLAPPAQPAATRAPTNVEPLTADLRRLHLTVPRSLLRKLEQARDALSHSHRGASEAEILEVGLDLILERAAKRRGLVKKPRKRADASEPSPAPERDAPRPRTRYIPAAVRRAVWQRDGGRCQYPLASGGVCGSTVRVQLDHLDPWAKGGASTVARLRLCCEVHNQRAARPRKTRRARPCGRAPRDVRSPAPR